MRPGSRAGYPAIYIAASSNIDSSLARSRRVLGIDFVSSRPRPPGSRRRLLPCYSFSAYSTLPTSGAFFGVETSRSVSLLVCSARRGKECTHTCTPTRRCANRHVHDTLGHPGRSREALYADEGDYRRPRSLAQLLITRLASDVHSERKGRGVEVGGNQRKQPRNDLLS